MVCRALGSQRCREQCHEVGDDRDRDVLRGGRSRSTPARRAGRPSAAKRLHARVFAELRRSLIHGVFEAGESAAHRDLAETLQTSTMPVREALGRLVSEQALEALPSRSVRVPLITRERLDDLARARWLVEGELTALALPNLAAADFAALRELTTACEAAFGGDDADKAQATSELNHAFHFRIYHAARFGRADPDRREPVAAVRALCPRRRPHP